MLSRPSQVIIADKPSFLDIGNINSKVKIFSLSLTRNQMVYKVHCDTQWSHPGIKGTFFTCKKEHDFKVSRWFVKDIVMRCERCQRFKSDRRKNKPFFREFVSPKEVGQEILIDIAGLFKYASHKYWLIVLVDRLSCFVWTHLIDHTPSANELFVYLHDTMKTSERRLHRCCRMMVLSSEGSSGRASAIARKSFVTKLRNHYPQSDGITERAIQTNKQKLRWDDCEQEIHQKLARLTEEKNSSSPEPIYIPPGDFMFSFRMRTHSPQALEAYGMIKESVYEQLNKYNKRRRKD
jgi:hypothetical protein